MHFSESMTWFLSLLPLVMALIAWIYWHNTDLYHDYTRMSKQDREEMAETMAKEFNAVSQQLNNLGHSMSRTNHVVHAHTGALESMSYSIDYQQGDPISPFLLNTTLAIPQSPTYVHNNGTFTYLSTETLTEDDINNIRRGITFGPPIVLPMPEVKVKPKPIEITPEKLVRPAFHEYD